MPEDQIQTIAAINSGSSTIKFGLFSCEDQLSIILKGKMTGIGTPGCLLEIENHEKHDILCSSADTDSAEKAADLIIQWLHQHSQYKINGIGHRVVHGGLQYQQPVPIDDSLINELKKLEPLAPLHLPDAISIINIFKQAFPDVLQIACFDTAFHYQMPFEAKHYSIPRYFWSEGLVRYGFHGISCEYIYEQLQQEYDLPENKKIIIAHLGSGSSITAVKDGQSIETTMGFSPAGGIMMNTRAGDIDPGVMIYLLKEKRMNPDQLDDLFNKQSGLKAVAETNDSMEKLLEKGRTDPKASQAILMYCYHAKKQIGALAAAMGGLDIIVFTGGIGEHSPVIRKQICSGLEFLGVELNDELNDSSAETINELSARVQVHVIPANEEMVIAKYVKQHQ